MILIGIALGLVTAGCADPGTGTLALSWRFADGRRCVDTGAATVTVGAPASLGSHACTEGQAPASASIDGVPRGGHLVVRALSPQQDELYRGELDLDVALQPTTLTLYATGVR